MDRFAAMQAYITVAQLLSFSKAAESLNLPKTSVSRQISSLERRLGVRLLNRTTRHVSLTAEGQLYYEDCVRLLEALDQSEAEVTSNPRGRLRISMAQSVAHSIVIPALPDFSARYPDLIVEIICSEQVVNLIADGVDCALRANTIKDETLIAKPLGALKVVTCASPSFLLRHGTPVKPGDVSSLPVVGFSFAKGGRLCDLNFTKGTKRESLKVNPLVRFSDVQSCVHAAIAGLGITQVPLFVLKEPLSLGSIRLILEEYDVDRISMYVVYPQSCKNSISVSVFVDWVRTLFRSL